MSKFDLVMPKLGESVQEATITNWFVKEGDTIEEDDLLLEIATDKVDSEIPSPVAGEVKKIYFAVDALVPVGTVIAEIILEGNDEIVEDGSITGDKPDIAKETNEETTKVKDDFEKSSRFYSPLVKNIASNEGISLGELEAISGSGINGRIQKKDILTYLQNKKLSNKTHNKSDEVNIRQQNDTKERPKVSVSVSAGDEIVQMDRMRKLIADNMIHSKHVSAHVTNMVECDATNIVLWYQKMKENFYKQESVKLTYLPVFLAAVAKALKEYPMINAAVDGDKIIIRKAINLGIAVALPGNNLIVPVIKKADQLNLLGLTKELTRLADAARANQLLPDDIAGGTFSISNFGTFRNVMGTPVIAQPQVAILAIGTIEKKPAVVETPTGDIIAIRHKMFLSLTYDHRIIDGALGGAFLRRLGDIIEEFDLNTTI